MSVPVGDQGVANLAKSARNRAGKPETGTSLPKSSASTHAAAGVVQMAWTSPPTPPLLARAHDQIQGGASR